MKNEKLACEPNTEPNLFELCLGGAGNRRSQWTRAVASLCLALCAYCTNMMAQTATFGYFSYEGKDARFDKPYDPSNQYLNPVIAGFYPDPSVCRKGDTYYLVNSSFAFYPGVPIFSSKDMVHWQQLGHVLDRDSQLKLYHHGVSDGIFAPAISYNKRNKTFYMVTMNMGERTVFYVKSKNPAEGWSEPFQLKHGGMDPSFLFDNDGKAYLVYTTRPKDGQRYQGEMAIHANRFYADADSVSSQSMELVRGGSQTENQPQWLEGPHVYHIGNYYYLMCAEGGTGSQHSEVIFRSHSLTGKWESCPQNPILTQRDLGNRDDAVSSTGHADLIQTPQGEWYAVFLGCRPYEGDLYNTGRETFLLPVTWQNGWPIILEKGKAIPTIINKKGLQPASDNLNTGNFKYTDDFKSAKLDQRWIFLRNPVKEFYSLGTDGITIKAVPADVSQKESIAAIFRRQQHATFTAETEVNFKPSTAKELAGMTLFQNENHHFVFGKTLISGKPAIILSRTDKETAIIGSVMLTEDEANKPLKLRVCGNGRYYSFYYSFDKGSSFSGGDHSFASSDHTLGSSEWQPMVIGADASNLSTHQAGGFTGTVIGLYATSNN
jgi:xylan 1,4-beta-xylosidase